MFNKNSKIIEDIKKKIQDLESDIDLIYELLQPPSKEPIGEEGDDYYAGTTAEIPGDIYREIIKYCENKNYIFMGIA